jgi:hypothetical protein
MELSRVGRSGKKLDYWGGQGLKGDGGVLALSYLLFFFLAAMG